MLDKLLLLLYYSGAGILGFNLTGEMKMLNPQQIFDTVVNGLRKQGKKSEAVLTEEMKKTGDFTAPIGKTVCLYRCGELKCGAGQLILDEFYDPSLEGKSVLSNEVKESLSKSGVGMGDGKRQNLVWLLQQVHDNREMETWEDKFKEVAQYNGLKYTEPDCSEEK